MSAPTETPLLARFDTGAVPARERFEFWRAVHPGVEMERSQDAGKPFAGSVKNLISTENGAVLCRTVTSANRSRFNEEARENVIIGALSGGACAVASRKGEQCLTPGRLYLINLRNTATFESPGFDNVFLSLPRATVTRALGGEAGDAGVAFLPDTPIGRIFQAHLAATAKEMTALSNSTRTAVLQTATSLADAVLRQSAEADAPSDADARGIVVAARRCMQEILHQPHITADHVARLTGYSRSSLYRAFQQQEHSIRETLTEMRIERALSLLANTQMQVGEVAAACGYTSFSAFSRAFQRARGYSPRDYRMGGPFT